MKWSSCFRFLRKLLILLILAMVCLVSLLSPVSLAASATSNKLWIWGANYTDQLGNGTINNSNIPLQLNGLNDLVSIAAGYSHVLVLKSDGTVWAWGTNIDGELGNGTNIDSNIPVQVSGLTGVVAIAATGDCNGEHSMALKSDGTVWVWGLNNLGQLCQVNNKDNSNIPLQVSALTDVVDIAAGSNYCMALKSDGTIWEWGLNYIEATLGDGTFNVYQPGTIIHPKGVIDVVAIAAGWRHSLALTSDGSVWAWGMDPSGQLGDASTNNVNTPFRVIGLDNIVAMSAGINYSLALKSDGTVWACGNNDKGQLGNGTFNSTLGFVHQVSNLTNIVAIAGGSTHCLALKADGTVWAWGNNDNGQLGNGTNDNSNIPVQVSGLTNVSAITAGGQQSFALVQSTPTPTTTPTLTSTLTLTSMITSSTPTPTPTLTPTPTPTPTSTLTPASTSTQEASSRGTGINSWWVWLIFGLVVVAVVGIVWSIRHKTNG